MDQIRTPDPQELIDSAHSMIPRLRARAEKCEELGRVPEESIEEMKDLRLFDITKPKAYGGLEMGWETFGEVAIKMGAGCASSGWVFSVLGQHPLLVNRIGKDCMDEIWTKDPDALIAATKWQSGSLKKVDGGYFGNGISTFGSGSLHSQWCIIGGAPVDDSDEVVGAVLPMEDIEILDTWHPDGLVGTGSHHIKLDNTFIPNHRARVPGKAPEGGIIDAPLYRTTGLGVPFGLSTVLVGNAMHALEIFIDNMRDRKSRDGAKIADIQSLQMRVGESAAEIDSAYRLIQSHLKGLMKTLEGLPAPTGAGGYEHGKWPELTGKGIVDGQWPAAGTGDDSPHIATANSYAAQMAYSAVERLSYAAGASQLDHTNPLLRCLRDATAGTRQYGINWDVARTRSGKSFLGA